MSYVCESSINYYYLVSYSDIFFRTGIFILSGFETTIIQMIPEFIVLCFSDFCEYPENDNLSPLDEYVKIFLRTGILVLSGF